MVNSLAVGGEGCLDVSINVRTCSFEQLQEILNNKSEVIKFNPASKRITEEGFPVEQIIKLQSILEEKTLPNKALEPRTPLANSFKYFSEDLNSIVTILGKNQYKTYNLDIDEIEKPTSLLDGIASIWHNISRKGRET
ncbi:MAG: hypothetical protein SFT90_01780 [Rickettsiales bacterium]|nr:hypothetical protein [Rickettsiales bacterium]